MDFLSPAWIPIKTFNTPREEYSKSPSYLFSPKTLTKPESKFKTKDTTSASKRRIIECSVTEDSEFIKSPKQKKQRLRRRDVKCEDKKDEKNLQKFDDLPIRIGNNSYCEGDVISRLQHKRQIENDPKQTSNPKQRESESANVLLSKHKSDLNQRSDSIHSSESDSADVSSSKHKNDPKQRSDSKHFCWSDSADVLLSKHKSKTDSENVLLSKHKSESDSTNVLSKHKNDTKQRGDSNHKDETESANVLSKCKSDLKQGIARNDKSDCDSSNVLSKHKKEDDKDVGNYNDGEELRDSTSKKSETDYLQIFLEELHTTDGTPKFELVYK